MFSAESIDSCLDRRIQQLDDQYDDTANNQDKAFETRASKPDRRRKQHDAQRNFLAKRRLVLPGVCETLCGKARRANDSAYAGIARFAHFEIPDSSLLWDNIIPNNARESRYTPFCRR